MTVDNRVGAKAAVRDRVWKYLEREGVSPEGASGHIPVFSGAEQAAEGLAALDVWRDARVLEAAPDRAQMPVRARALIDRKIVYMAVPDLATHEPFRALEPDRLPVNAVDVASHQGAMRVGVPVSLDQMLPVDLVVTGSVAVNLQGVRLGKGAGFGDLEMALLTAAGVIGDDTVIVTTVHDLQVLDEGLPEAPHDVRVDLIVTPTRVLTCPQSRGRPRLIWEHLTPERIAAIPVLTDWRTVTASDRVLDPGT